MATIELDKRLLVDNEVTKIEEELLLKAFRDFKSVLKELRQGGELRVAMDVDRQTGEPEIIHAGYNIKRSLDSTRTIYAKRREQRTFGLGRGNPA